jgi:hypothetical protein
MSQRTSGLSRFVQIIGRYRALIGLMALLGVLGGAVSAALNPPETTSKALVVFTAPSCPQGAICGGPMFSPGYIDGAVLKVVPSGVQIKLVTGTVMSVSATAGTPAQAKANAEAAVRRYIADAGSLTYLGEKPSARVLEPATAATGTTPPKQVFGDALLGAVFGALVGVIAALAGSRTTIDPVALPQGLGADGLGWGAGQEDGYTPAGIPLEELARQYAERRAASDGSLDRSEAEPPWSGIAGLGG